MNTYILALSGSHVLNETLRGLREVTREVPDVEVSRGWRQGDSSGGYVAIRAPRSDDLRRALSDLDLNIDGIVELLPPQASDPSITALTVHRSHVLNNAFNIYGYAPERLIWCDMCKKAHRPGRHVK